MKTTTDMQLVPISKLVPYVNNARTHSPEQVMKLRSSLREFGFINPIIIDRDYGIIAGHGRLLAAKEEGITEVPCVFVDYLTEAQKKAYILADNRMAMDAGWDEELLRVEIEALQGEAFDVSLTGFDEKELADLFKDGSDSDAEDDDYDLSAALEKAAFVKRGDIWTVGRHAIVIDTFGGSGSTLMACEQMNRTCCTMELDEKYASVILRRYVDDTGDADGVYVIRDGEKLPYAALVKDVEPAS